MPANLTPEYLEAEEEFRKAETTAEKIAALERMLSVIPKHKGTEKMQADIKRRLSKLKNEAEKQRRKGGGHDPFVIERHGAGQVAVIGFANAGKSQLVASLTGAPLEVADYPYTTTLPHPAMMPFEDIQIQLIDTPPVLSEEIEGTFAGLVRRADAVMVVLDLSKDDVLEQADSIFKGLENRKVKLIGTSPVSPPHVGGIEGGGFGIARRPAIIVGNKLDLEGAWERWEVVREFYGQNFPASAVSAQMGDGLAELRRRIFESLHIIRVYAKPPGQKPDLERPFVMKKGSTVLDLAEAVHREFVQKLKFARVWGSAEHDGQPVARTHLLQDGDIVELHV